MYFPRDKAGKLTTDLIPVVRTKNALNRAYFRSLALLFGA